MIVVLDVSAAIEILLKKKKADLFNKHFQKSEWIVAPDLYVSEITSVFWKYYQGKIFSQEACIQGVEDGMDLVDDFVEGKDLWKETLGESIKNRHSVYDLYYAVLARRNAGTLLTNDGDLASICRKLNIDVIH